MNEYKTQVINEDGKVKYCLQFETNDGELYTTMEKLARDIIDCKPLDIVKNTKYGVVRQMQVSISFMNSFTDMLYNQVEHQMLEWLNEHYKEHKEEWREFMGSVEQAIYDSVCNFMVSKTEKGAWCGVNTKIK